MGWTLPENNGDYSVRRNLLKSHFSRNIGDGEPISKSRQNPERGLWQRRFWAHLIEDQEDNNRHVDYIHWHAVKLGHAKNVIDWPYSSFHRYLRQGIYTNDWGNGEKYDIKGIE
jgi:putative transposase